MTTPVRYPPQLDMRPFLSSTVLTKRFSMSARSLQGLSPADAAYELYAIVCHKGNLQVSRWALPSPQVPGSLSIERRACLFVVLWHTHVSLSFGGL